MAGFFAKSNVERNHYKAFPSLQQRAVCPAPVRVLAAPSVPVGDMYRHWPRPPPELLLSTSSFHDVLSKWQAGVVAETLRTWPGGILSRRASRQPGACTASLCCGMLGAQAQQGRKLKTAKRVESTNSVPACMLPCCFMPPSRSATSPYLLKQANFRAETYVEVTVTSITANVAL